MKKIPKKGKIEISLRLEDPYPKIIIRDTGFAFSEEKMQKLPVLDSQKSIAFPEDPSDEDIKQVTKMCGWEIHPLKKQGLFNVTEISLRQKDERRVYKDSNVIYLNTSKGGLLTV